LPGQGFGELHKFVGQFFKALSALDGAANGRDILDGHPLAAMLSVHPLLQHIVRTADDLFCTLLCLEKLFAEGSALHAVYFGHFLEDFASAAKDVGGLRGGHSEVVFVSICIHYRQKKPPSSFKFISL
jgi:hypothetical protein